VARAREHGLAEISDVALLKRLRNCGPWIQRISQGLSTSRRSIQAPQEFLGKYNLRAVDSTIVREQGAKGSQWRIHYSIRLPTLECDSFQLSSARTAESLKHLSIQSGDLILADRGYCRGEDLEWIKGCRAEYVVRLHSTSLPLTDRRNQPIDLLRCARSLRDFRPRQWAVQFTQQDRTYPGRLCIVRRSAASAQLEREKVLESARTSGQEASTERLALADYVLLVTSLTERDLTTHGVFEIYRSRWQIELSFKRLKSLLELGLLPKYDPDSSRAWLQVKLLTALLIEQLLIEAGAFSPWGFAKLEAEPLGSIH
jgi:hypothetical protein